MDAKTYSELALKTESVPTEVKFGTLGLHAMLVFAVAAGEVLNQAKRAIYYGKELDRETLMLNLMKAGATINYMGREIVEDRGLLDPKDLEVWKENNPDIDVPSEVQMNLANVDVRLLHASIGMFTESAELLELLLRQFEGQGLDTVAFGEELGDVDWYKALGHDASGVSEATSREANIKKLQDKQAGRYRSGGFNAAEAGDRDLDAERALLNESIASTAVH